MLQGHEYFKVMNIILKSNIEQIPICQSYMENMSCVCLCLTSHQKLRSLWRWGHGLVTSNRLEKLGLAPVTPDLQGARLRSSVSNVSDCRCMSADPGVVSLIPTQSHTLVEIDHEIISTVILLPSADTKRVVVSYKQKYVH